MKDINASGIAALNAGYVELMLAVEMEISDTPSETIRVHSRKGTYSIDSDDYLGVGTLGKVSPVSVKGDAKPSGISLELSGIDSTLIAKAMSYNYKGRPVKLMVVILDTTDYSIIDTNTIFSGKVDTMDIKAGSEGVIVVKCENRLVDWQRADNSKYSQESHNRTLPVGVDDPFFVFLNGVITKEIEFTPFTNWKANA